MIIQIGHLVLLPTTLIKQGTNEITAKFSCKPNPSLASFYSVNVTGVLPRAQKG